MHLFFYDTPIGKFGLAEQDEKLTHLFFETDRYDETAFTVAETPVLKEAYKQLLEYSQGKRKEFTIPLAPVGTEFFRQSWQALTEIPYGETRTYKEIAEQIGNPKAVRAVGMANNRNPIPIFIPCHRVIGSNQKLVGFRGGLDMKAALLELERSHQ